MKNACAKLHRSLRSNAFISPLYGLLPAVLRARLGHALRGPLIQPGAFPTLPAVADSQEEIAGAEATTGPDGLNLYGFLGMQFGLGEGARLYARAFSEHGLAVTAHDVDIDLPHARADYSLPRCSAGTPDWGVDLVCVNPDVWDRVRELLPARTPGRLRIASWFWELEELPPAWKSALDDFDAILVATDFVRSAVSDFTTKPVLYAPLPLYVGNVSAIGRAQFGLPEDKTIFLASFDFFSSMARKNPLAAIEAFRVAFPPGDDRARLVIKTSHGRLMQDDLRLLLDAVGDDPRILVRDGSLHASHWRALQQCCDAYVSLHRAEGFGLGLAECMALGKPVIATGWSGNMDFMSNSTALLVRATRVPVKKGQYFHADGSHWAEPDVEHAASHMRWVADSPDAARKIGLSGQDSVNEKLAPARIANMFKEQMVKLRNAHQRVDVQRNLS